MFFLSRVLTVALFIILFVSTATAAETPVLAIDSGGHMAAIEDLIFTADGKELVSVSSDKTIRVWDVEAGEIIRTLRYQIGASSEGKIYCAALSPDDRWLAIGGFLAPRGTGNSGRILIFDFASGEVSRVLEGHTNVVRSLAFSPDGRYLLSGSSDKKARIWNVLTGKSLQTLTGHEMRIYDVAFSPDGARAVTGSDDKTIKLWSASSGTMLKTLEGHTVGIRTIAFTPDSKYLLSAGKDKTIRLWDGATGEFIKIMAETTKRVDGLSISADGTKALVGNIPKNGPFPSEVYVIPSGEKLLEFKKHDNNILATAISPDGTLAATGGGNEKPIYLWNLSDGSVRHKLAGRNKSIWSVGFSRDGKSIALGKAWRKNSLAGYGTLTRSFNLFDGREFRVSQGEELTDDSTYIRGRLKVGSVEIKTDTGKIHKTLQILKSDEVKHEITRDATNGYDHRSLTLTPDGLTVISGGSNGFINSYSAATGEKIHAFAGHTGGIWGVATSPDGRWLVSGSADQTVKIWDIASGKNLLTIFAAEDGEWVAWTPEGYYSCSTKGDRYIGWHINQGIDKSALYYPASRFAYKFHQPAVVDAYLMTNGDLDEAIKIANSSKSRLDKIEKTTATDLQNILPPAVFFKNVDGREVVVNEPSIRIKAGARSLTADPVTDIWVTVNGRKLSTQRGISLTKKDANQGGSPSVIKQVDVKNAALEITVPLTEENSRIALFAANRHGQSEPEIINVTWKKTRATQGGGGVVAKNNDDLYKPNLYLLSIGVSTYEDPSLSLDVADKDALAITRVMKKQQGKLYRNVKARTLINGAATKDDVLDGLDWLLAEATQKDTAVIFIAGHGMKDERGNYYFLPYDADPKKLRRSGVKWFDFQDVLASVPSKVILLADTCHSGSITGKRRGVTDMTDALRDLVNSDSGVVVMTAATGREVSQERPEWGHGAFTKALIEGLEGKANYNNDSRIDIKELDLYVTERVKTLTNGAQHPTTEIPRTLPNFPVVVN